MKQKLKRAVVVQVMEIYNLIQFCAWSELSGWGGPFIALWWAWALRSSLF